jgi:hypothetical protein
MGHASRKVMHEDKRGDRTRKGILYHTKEVGYRTGQEMNHNREWAMLQERLDHAARQEAGQDNKTIKGI